MVDVLGCVLNAGFLHTIAGSRGPQGIKNSHSLRLILEDVVLIEAEGFK